MQQIPLDIWGAMPESKQKKEIDDQQDIGDLYEVAPLSYLSSALSDQLNELRSKNKTKKLKYTR